MKTKNVILIKLGGSVITDKTKERTANVPVIKQLAQEIAGARKQTNDLFIIAHGQGSFAHRSAAKYKTIAGLTNEASKLGMAKVRQDCIALNALVLAELINASIPAITQEPASFLTAKNRRLSSITLITLITLISHGLVPVVYGDVIPDTNIGCTIFSGEQVLNYIALELPKHGYTPKLIIEVGKTQGVLDQNGHTIAEITQKNYKTVEKLLKGSESTDVTGGMLHKVQEAMGLAKHKIPTHLISAKTGDLKQALIKKALQGTWIA